MRAENMIISLQREMGSGADPWVRLEQPPVNTARLTAEDLQIMLAMVRAGQSAHEYRQPDCPVVVANGQVTIPLTVWVWPSTLELAWNLRPELLLITDPPTVLRQERDFDLVVEMRSTVDLPFYASALTLEWQTPCYNRLGEEVGRPEITHLGSRLSLSAEVFGVLRVRCMAEGWQQIGQVVMPITEGSAVTSIRPTVTAVWSAPDDTPLNERIELQIPACAEDLLAFCPDETLRRKRSSTVTDEDNDKIPVVYYSPCDGRVLEVRYELP
jgi:hypothetical protein